MEARALILSVRDRAGLRSVREAERALRATLGAVACALASDDVRALSAALPHELHRSLRSGSDRVGTLDDLYEEAGQRERVRQGFAREHTQVVLEVLATTLEPELVERIRKHLPPDIAALLRAREIPEEPPPHVHAHPGQLPAPRQTLSRSRPGTADPIADATHTLAHSGSVSRSRAGHAESMVETARSTRPGREDETLASRRPKGRPS